MPQAKIADFLDLWATTQAKRRKQIFKIFLMDEETMASTIFPAYLSTHGDIVCFLGQREVS